MDHRDKAKKKFLEEQELEKKKLEEEQAHLKEKQTQGNVFMDYDYKDQPNKMLSDEISMEKIDSETVDSADFYKKHDPNYNGNNQLKYEKKDDLGEILRKLKKVVKVIQKISKESSFKEKKVISFPFDYRNYSLNDIRDSLYKFLNYSDALYLNLSQATTKEDAIKYIELIKDLRKIANESKLNDFQIYIIIDNVLQIYRDNNLEIPYDLIDYILLDIQRNVRLEKFEEKQKYHNYQPKKQNIQSKTLNQTETDFSNSIREWSKILPPEKIVIEIDGKNQIDMIKNLNFSIGGTVVKWSSGNENSMNNSYSLIQAI
uniref:Uncharacterized protein n=1 Tax=Acrobeloides nanus TaxID=290746 RepID=A0A914E414_9BILA